MVGTHDYNVWRTSSKSHLKSMLAVGQATATALFGALRAM